MMICFSNLPSFSNKLLFDSAFTTTVYLLPTFNVTFLNSTLVSPLPLSGTSTVTLVEPTLFHSLASSGNSYKSALKVYFWPLGKFLYSILSSTVLSVPALSLVKFNSCPSLAKFPPNPIVVFMTVFSSILSFTTSLVSPSTFDSFSVGTSFSFPFSKNFKSEIFPSLPTVNLISVTVLYPFGAASSWNIYVPAFKEIFWEVFPEVQLKSLSDSSPNLPLTTCPSGVFIWIFAPSISSPAKFCLLIEISFNSSGFFLFITVNLSLSATAILL